MLSKIFRHWIAIFVISVVLLPVSAIALHYAKKFMEDLGVDPAVLELFRLVTIYIALLDAIIIMGTGTIGVLKLLKEEAE
jgi:hypothetical protein